MRHASILLAVCIAAICATAGPVARAQSNPNVDQIVKSLNPTPSGSGDTRGIRVGRPTDSAGRPAQISLNVLFATGSAELTPQAIETLNTLGQALTNPSLAGYRFRVEGHTDTVGSSELNKALSERRAVSVVAYLTSKFPVDTARLQPVGMGKEGLLVVTPDQTAEPRNRRVLVVNTGN